jgi:hypothetical protein
MRLVSWRAIDKGSLISCTTGELPNGLRIIDAAVFTGRNGPWASLPRKPVLDRDGKSGSMLMASRSFSRYKPQFQLLIEWRDRALSDAFSDAVIDLVRQAHPGAIDAAPAA